MGGAGGKGVHILVHQIGTSPEGGHLTGAVGDPAPSVEPLHLLGTAGKQAIF